METCIDAMSTKGSFIEKGSFMNNIFSIFEKEFFFTWIIWSSLLTTVVYIVCVVATKIYYLVFFKKNEDVGLEETVRETLQGPNCFFNSVEEIIVSNT